jgi:hypothetical protein
MTELITAFNHILSLGRSPGIAWPVPVNTVNNDINNSEGMLYVGDDKGLRGLYAYTDFKKDQYVAYLTGAKHVGRYRPTTLPHVWVFQISTCTWVTIDPAEYGILGNLINCHVPGSESIKSINCVFRVTYGCNRVNIATNAPVLKGTEFIISYQGQGLETVQDEITEWSSDFNRLPLYRDPFKVQPLFKGDRNIDQAWLEGNETDNKVTMEDYSNDDLDDESTEPLVYASDGEVIEKKPKAKKKRKGKTNKHYGGI